MEQIPDLIGYVIHFGKIPTDLEEGIIVSSPSSTIKGRQPWVTKSSSHQSPKSLDQVMEILEGGWELSTTTSAHKWYAVCLHTWKQHHWRHIHCTPIARNVSCRQQDTVHNLCRFGEGIRSCTHPCYHYTQSPMPSKRQCTWPMSIWKRYSTVCPDMSSGGFFASLVLRSGWCGS